MSGDDTITWASSGAPPEPTRSLGTPSLHVEEVERLLQVLKGELGTDWFDEEMFKRRVDALILRTEHHLSAIKQQDPSFDRTGLKKRLRHIMLYRMRMGRAS